ncbi:tetratricopeptide repeat protein [Thalassotalea sp. ND16A]|uniref:tetratricopeptide repeat protein n=1 Tax=Thalassotalea sp. ND16A TaxID=1535422 RepID=UPI00051DCE22|nr:hypothetical protein [Thalassotalea sp. ND16A]KGJ90254.1 hypothetical protein ND16A_1984 [Thalassotalea sp. ND16A]
MSLQRMLFILMTMSCTLVISNSGLSHEGHEHQDLTISKLGNLGNVDFDVSCSDKAQQAMNTGVGLLHHMMYAQAENLFHHWIAKDPECAMLYWGYSMTLFHPLWPDTIKEEALQRGAEVIKKATELNASTREKYYIQAAASYYENWQVKTDKERIAAWAKAQEAVYQQYPDDIDATAFYALSQIVMAPKQDATFSQQQKAGKLLAKIHKSLPTHPGAIHYTIHAYDSALLAKHAVEAARAYDQIAPDVPHALHMPTHIFVRLGMWDDVISWNTRSAKAALKYPSQGTTSMHYIHAIDYLIYGYLQSEDKSKALAVIKEVEAHHPIQATFPAAYALTTIPARMFLEQKQWQLASQLKTQTPAYIDWMKFPQIEAITYYTRGLGAARNGDVNAAKENLKVLDQLYDKTLTISPKYWAPLVDAQRQVVTAWISYEQGNKKQAINQLKRAADIEDSLDKNPVTPGAVLPARELLADMYMLNGDYAKALTAYNDSLSINPNRLNSLTGASAASKQIKQ